MADVCQHNKFGYCKYSKTCFKKHIKDICDNKSCDVKNCSLRHPKKCLYFKQFHYCKFGDFCLYKHVNIEKDIKYSDRINYLETRLAEKNATIDSLETKLSSLEDMFKRYEKSTETRLTNLEDVLKKQEIEVRDLNVSFKKFEKPTNYHKHDVIHLQDISEKVINGKEKEVGNGDKHVCPVCDANCETSYILEKHMSSHDTIIQLDGNVSMENHEVYEIGVLYPCDQCDFQSSHKSNLLKHIAKKHKPNNIKNSKQRRKHAI